MNVEPLHPGEGLVVQKYGGSSLATPERIRRVADRRRLRRPPAIASAWSSRRWETRPTTWSGSRPRSRRTRRARAGHAARRLANGFRWHSSRWRSSTSVATAVSFTGAAGRHHHRCDPRQGADHRGPAEPRRPGTGFGHHRHRRRFPGRLDHRRRDHAGSGRIGHDRRRAGSSAERRRLRDLHRCRRGLHGRPSRRPRRPEAAGRLLRGDARARDERGTRADVTMRRVRRGTRHPDPCPVIPRRGGGNVGHSGG